MQGERLSADRLKQRLTGGIALLLLGVIAWFWLLGADSPVDPVAQETQIPPAPAIERFEVAQPRQPEGIDPAPLPGASADEEPVVVVKTPEPRPTAPKPTPAATPSKPVPTKPAPAAAPRPAAVPATSTAAAPQPRLERDARGLPQAWAVQVASLSSQAAADKLKTDLAAKGHKAYTRRAGKAVRVYVGPKLSREQAGADKRAIDTAFKVNSMVVRFTPE